ncbi:MutS2 family protein [Pullulanibacillus pueri]|uniref:Endonuclease MutS2 n=1 Tax=Pullulanibacillus pueri TaxID=1437324 RepID=A0A8J3ELY6_9BACL|nr:endonuclease MutS2 [Pullulanibacillus pueri]MBM7680788.1 MutS2 family protein [Pullulanibacillus pueri]GGH78335.1 endonuclease MutS2 [Pullulanibacillus pueri]
MNSTTITTLQFDQLKDEIATYTISELGTQAIKTLEPSKNKKQIEAWLGEVTEAKNILKISSSVPIHGLKGIDQILRGLHKGLPLRPDSLTQLKDFLECLEKMKRFMKDKQEAAPRITSYVYSLFDLHELFDEIHRCIRNGRVDDYASKALLSIRKQITILEERIKARVEQMLKSSKYSSYLQEAIVSLRHGRYTLPIKVEYKKKIKGSILDASSSGSTLYIEPDEIAAIQDDLDTLKLQEEWEVEGILQRLTGLVEANEREIRIAVDTMVRYDVIFAKAKYSEVVVGISPIMNEHHTFRLIEARHPMLGQSAVPLNITLGDTYDALVITGPNTGGKTVTIKTVGLLTMMAQSGLHIPAQEGTEIAIFDDILVDIGDGQSIEQSLSTFSSRIKNIIHILSETTPRTLVLLDELGSGTDPAEGMGLAASILEELYNKGATLLATTHYNEIKDFASEHEGFENGSMAFDLQTLKPTYQLLIGKGGESQAFAIALRLGMHPKLIERAHRITYEESKSYQADTNFDQHILERQLAMHTKPVYKQKHKAKGHHPSPKVTFKQGDNVKIKALNEYGIVYQPANDRGDVIVFVKGEKRVINQKRLSLYIKAEDLYPEDYDMDIIFETKENRKIRKEMTKHHVEGLTIEHEND